MDLLPAISIEIRSFVALCFLCLISACKPASAVHEEAFSVHGAQRERRRDHLRRLYRSWSRNHITSVRNLNVLLNPVHSPNLTKKLGALVVQYLLIAYFIACGYFLFAVFDGCATVINRWLPPTFLNDDDQPVRKYLYGLYFSYDMLLRLGVGINPRTPPQIIFSIFTLLVGVIVVAQLIGSFSIFLQVYNHGESAFKDRMNQLSNYVTKNHFPKLIRKKVLNFYKSQWHDIGSVDMNTVLDVLPQRLREDVLFTVLDQLSARQFKKSRERSPMGSISRILPRLNVFSHAEIPFVICLYPASW